MDDLISPAVDRRRAFAILFVSLVGMGAGQSVMFAILPTLARALGLSEFQASLPFVISATIWVFTSGYWGGKSDVWGRKPVILLGLIGFGTSFALFAGFAQLATAGVLSVAIVFPLLIASRALYGLFGSGASPAAQAYVADRTARAERVAGVATITAAFGLGTTLGPGIGAALVVFGLFAPFYATAAAAFLGAGAIWFFLPEHSPPRLRHTLSVRFRWHDKRILPYVLYGTGVYSAGAIPLQTIGFFIIDVLHPARGIAPQWTGLGLVAMSAAALVAQIAVTRSRALKAQTLMALGAVLAAVSFVLILMSVHLTTLVIALALNGLGLGLVRPGFAAAASFAVGSREQGTMAGLVGATAGAGFIFGPLIATSLYRLSPQAPYWFGAGLMALCLAYGFRALAPNGEAEIPEDIVL